MDHDQPQTAADKKKIPAGSLFLGWDHEDANWLPDNRTGHKDIDAAVV